MLVEPAIYKETNMIYFYNKEVMDIRAVKMFGLSVKGSDNPIGYFGTGLKYAVAIIINNGGSVTMALGTDIYEFTKARDEFRGVEYDSIQCNGVDLPFTTALGKHWELWQAYRELYCNAKDEDGGVSDTYPEGAYGTVISVEGLDQVYKDRGLYFLDTPPTWSDDNIEIHPGSGGIFYKGVRVKELDSSLYNYNMLCSIDLTEDRGIKDSWSVRWRIARSIMDIDDVKIIENFALMPQGCMERSLDFGSNMSPEWLEWMNTNRSNLHIFHDFREIFRRLEPAKSLDTIGASEDQNMYIDKAVDTLHKMGFEITQDIRIVESLGGNGVLAAAIDGDIILSKQLFNKGFQTVLLAVLEEHVHIFTGYNDETRALQTYLFNEVIRQYARSSGEVI